MPTTHVCMLVRNDCRTDYRVLKEAGSLARAGFQVTVVGMNAYGPLERELRDGFEIVRVPVERARSPLGKVVNLFPKTIRRMADVAAGLSAAVYHAHDADTILPAWLAARRVPGSRLIYDAHEVGFTSFLESFSFYPFKLPVITWAWSRWNDRIVRRDVDRVITVNHVLAELQAKHYGIREPAVVMNCPPRFFARPEHRHILRDRIGLPADVRIAICQGMFSLARGDGPALQALVRSTEMLEHAAVVIIGNIGISPQFAALRALAGQPEYAGRVFILPPVPPQELLIYTAGADLGLIPLALRGLLRYASPNKLFEYVATGLPVLTEDLPLIRQLCDEYGCGLVSDFTRPNAIADSINRLLRDEALRASLQAGAERAAQVYNWENQEKALLGVYRELLGQVALVSIPDATLPEYLAEANDLE